MRPTKSASESSSAPIKLLFFLHRATLPSKKSKNRPKGMKVSAAHKLPLCVGSKQYLIEDMMDMTPQKPFKRVMKSARW